MALTFYFAPMSTSNITDAVLRELGCAVTRIQVSLQAGDARTPEFLRLNPNGEVPLIIDDGVAIWESAAITLYLGDRYGAAAGLFPASGPRRGEAMSWVVWAAPVPPPEPPPQRARLSAPAPDSSSLRSRPGNRPASPPRDWF
ncbi:MAG: glutathione S-transferase N-terminal domain-containing protein, partial [Pseudomonadota bacterium]